MHIYALPHSFLSIKISIDSFDALPLSLLNNSFINFLL